MIEENRTEQNRVIVVAMDPEKVVKVDNFINDKQNDEPSETPASVLL